MQELQRFYRLGALTPSQERDIYNQAQALGISLGGIESEDCYYVEFGETPSDQAIGTVWGLLQETFEPEKFGTESFLSLNRTLSLIVEIGPRLNFETPFSTTATNICRRCGVPVTRLERSRRIWLATDLVGIDKICRSLVPLLFDRMTEEEYPRPLSSLGTLQTSKPVKIYPVLEGGKHVLEEANTELGLGMDSQDIEFCYDLVVNVLRRNPTDAELFQIGQANSEHCRHWFFKGKQGQHPDTLMDIVKRPWQTNPGNSLIAFDDDSSAILVPWQSVKVLQPSVPGIASPFVHQDVSLQITLTAETHNFPTGVAPYPGAQTGTGGRIRDNLAVGRGGLMGIGGVGIAVGNLHIPGYPMPWEKDDLPNPKGLATPLEIAIWASNGSSNYGNCIGEPVPLGFFRADGLWVGDGEYRSNFKPIMYTCGLGQLDRRHVEKGEAVKGLKLVQIGGKAYRIGLGGGAASSMVQGDNKVELDFNAVQRGDAEMEQRVWRVMRACSELGDENPIVSVHDLGAGGDCNALPEIALPAGACINLRSIPLGDSTLSVMEYWGNESQERMAILMREENLERFQAICAREQVPCDVVGDITGDGQLVVYDELDGTTPVDLPLDKILGQLPQKSFSSIWPWYSLAPKARLPKNLTVEAALRRVLRLPSVASKGWLTRKVDRSVGGLVVQQQGVGPFDTALCGYAVMAQSHEDIRGAAITLGERPIIGLVSPEAMGRMGVAEAELKMSPVVISKMSDIRCSANWMLAAKLDAEGDWLYRAATAMSDLMIKHGIAVDGGKDSLSMAVKTVDKDGAPITVKAPGQLVISAYAPVPDVTKKVTPDLKPESMIVLVDLSGGKCRLGGSALLECYGQIGTDCPDVDDPDMLKRAFEVVQRLVETGLVTAVHNRSDGGLITAVIEMAIAGDVGVELYFDSDRDPISTLFNEELGLVLGGLAHVDADDIIREFREVGIPAKYIGETSEFVDDVTIIINDEEVYEGNLFELKAMWEETSYQLERLQSNPECAKRERHVVSSHLKHSRDKAHQRYAPRVTRSPKYNLSFTPNIIPTTTRPKIAVLREQGVNGDREMITAFHRVGFDVEDPVMADLSSGAVSLDRYQGLVFPGGFAFGDVLGAGRGWAGTIQHDERVKEQFERFYHRNDTFSFGVCNGCQLMTVLGWVPFYGQEAEKRPRFIRNLSEKFESRFPMIEIVDSPAMMLQGMAGTRMGVWVAHGEGRLHVPQESVLKRILKGNLAPMRYVYPDGRPTRGGIGSYPFNPNGSPLGITALCSPDGRHLAMMPHPERLFDLRQWPYLPDAWKDLEASPWLKIFQNAYSWCLAH